MPAYPTISKSMPLQASCRLHSSVLGLFEPVLLNYVDPGLPGSQVRSSMPTWR